jgi:hypothetical protein
MADRFRALRIALVLGTVTSLAGCDGIGDDVRRPPGEPLPGLTEAQLASFERGRELFDRQWTPEQGLGPL